MTEVWHLLQLTEFPSSVKVFENVNRQADGLKIHPQTKHLLGNFFGPHNQLLARLLSDKRYLWNNYYQHSIVLIVPIKINNSNTV